MQAIRKSFEELNKAKIDVNKIKTMSEAMANLSATTKKIQKEYTGISMTGLGMFAGGWFSANTIRTTVENAKQLEYAILQVGIAGELTRGQMNSLKEEMYDLSRATGKSAIEITGALDAIIKTGHL